MDKVHPLRRYREREQISQQRLADLLGVTKASISRWEAGERQIRMTMLSQVSERTGIPPQQLRSDLAAIMEAAE